MILGCFTLPKSNQGPANAESKDQSKQNSNLFVLFVKWNSILNQQALRNLPKRQLKGKLLSQVDFMTGLTSKNADKTREI